MFRGTTPTLYFKLKNIEDLSTINDIWITFQAKDKVILNKTFAKEEIKINEEEKIASIDLTQEETLAFPMPCIKAQMKILFDDNKVCASPIFTIPVENPINAGIMELIEKEEEPDIDIEEPDDTEGGEDDENNDATV